MYIYIYIYYIYIIHYYLYTCNHENNVPSRLSPRSICGNSCTLAHHVPKCISCHKAIGYDQISVVITGRAHCFHDYMYIMPILLL